MKIAVWYNLPSGGAKRALYYHVRGLVERGHHVEAWCPPTADQTYLPLGGLVTQHIVPMDRVWGPPRTLFERAAGKYAQATVMVDALGKHSRQCAEEIAAGKFDVLFANSCQFSACPPIGRCVDMPKLVYLQEPARHLYEGFRAGPDGRPSQVWIAGPPGQSWLSGKALASRRRQTLALESVRLRAREEVYNARAYDAILVNSIFSRESVFRAYGIVGRVCYLGIDAALFEEGEQVREDFVIGLGAFQDGKNIEFVIRSLARTKLPRPRLVWVGNFVDGDFDVKMVAMAQSLGVEFEPRVMVSDKELVDLLSRAKMMVYAPFLEPFGFAPLEANLCGLPVVAVAEGGLRETIVDGVNGLLAEPDPQQMANAIDRLRCDEDLYARIHNSCRGYVVEKWSLAAAIDRLEQNLTQVAAA